MLFDYLPGFITSEHLNQARTGITSGDALKELLETGVRSAKTTSTTSTSAPPVMIDSPVKPSSRKQLLSSADSLLLQSYDSREANASGSVTAAAAAVAASADSNSTRTTIADTYAAIDETPSEHSRALIASMQLHAVVSDPCCSLYLESYLSKVTARSKKTSSKTSTRGDLPAPELQDDAFAPDLIMACLLEIDDFKRAEDRAHRNHRAQLIISRYGIPEFEVQDLIQMRTACVREVDPSAFDLVYVLLSTRLLIEHAQGFIESSEFKELDRVLQQQNAFSSTGDTASKVGNIRNFVLEKLGLKESVHTSSSVAVAAQNEALQNVEDLLKTLEGVLSLALGRSLFKRFSTQQFQEENVCFFLEVMFYKLESYLTPAEGSAIYADRTNVPEKQSTNTNNSCKIAAQGEMELSEMRRLRAEHIAAKYIEVGSKRQINISSAMRHTILDGVKPPVTTTVNDDGTTSTSGGNSSANMSYDKSKQGVKSRLQIGGFTSMTSLDSASMATAITTASTGGTTATTPSATTTSATTGRCAAASERTAASGRKATTTTTAAAVAPLVTAAAAAAAAAAVADDTPAGAVAVVSDTVCTQSDYDAAVWTPSLNVFDVAQKEVLHLMKQNLWLKFTGSPLYESLVRQISKRATIGVMVRAGKISTALVQGATKHQQ
jgi:Regulator of G protein signaling domain